MKDIEYKRTDERFENVANWEKVHGIEFEIPNMFLSIARKYKDYTKDIETFIETGTFEAVTTQLAAELFDNVYTVEKYVRNNPYTGKDLFKHYLDVSKKYSNIRFHEGSSFKFLEHILKNKDQCVILLDAHTPTSCPLLKEFLCRL